MPPYDPKSRFYGFIKSPKRPGEISLGGQPGAVRNPVLAHLDQELTNNPFRGKRAQQLPPM